MVKPENDKEVSETLKVIKKALEEESPINEIKNDVLFLTKMVQNDGTILDISNLNDKKNSINKEEILNILDMKIEKIFDKHFERWLNKNMPSLLDKYFSKK